MAEVVKPRFDPAKHNYWKKVVALAKKQRVGVHEIDVAHDNWCAFWQGGYCDCNPTVSVRKESR